MTESRSRFVEIGTVRHAAFLPEIVQALREATRESGGLATRSEAWLAGRLERGDTLWAMETGPEPTRWIGFCAIQPWSEERFVSTSALIVRSDSRGRGIARDLKTAALDLCERNYPEATIFGLSTSPAIVHLNRELGFRPAAYAELPQDPDFWAGCQGCRHHAELIARRRESCHCEAMVRPPSPGRTAPT